MRRTPVLDQLAREIGQARSLQLVPSTEAVERWYGLAQQLVAEAREEWQCESAFRLRTGASRRWCARNFSRFLAQGLARGGADGGREWHLSARAPRAHPADAAGIVEEIVESFRGLRAS